MPSAQLTIITAIIIPSFSADHKILSVRPRVQVSQPLDRQTTYDGTLFPANGAHKSN